MEFKKKYNLKADAEFHVTSFSSLSSVSSRVLCIEKKLFSFACGSKGNTKYFEQTSLRKQMMIKNIYN